MKSYRRRAREIALQALYTWQLAGGDAREILEQAKALEGYDRCDQVLAGELVGGVLSRAAELEALLLPCVTGRSFGRLSPVERAILYIGALELMAHPETPFKVVVNEAIELGKSFGGAEGHRFVNGVLEKLAARLRPDEVARSRQTA
ncbi:MAG: transcription antitermination factor NusB [Burkholderiales bacterium]|jgi:N utilization substance protein B